MNKICPYCHATGSFCIENEAYLCLSCEKEGPVSELERECEEVDLLSSELSTQQLLQDVFAFYHERFIINETAKNFLGSRKLYDVEAIKLFRIGYSDRTLSKKLPRNTIKAGKEVRDALVQAGLYNKENRQERFRSSLIVPVFDEEGIIHQAFGIRTAQTSKSEEYHLPTPFMGWWNPQALNSEKLIICTNITDALSFWNHGFKYVSSLYGLNGLSDAMLSRLSISNVKDVFLAFPNSKEGNKAFEEIANKLMKEGLLCHRILLPANKAVNKLITASNELPAHELEMLLTGAEFIGGGHTAMTAGDLQSSATNCRIIGDDIHFTFGERRYRVRGLDRNKSFDALRINIQVTLGDYYHVDSIDLLHAKNRTFFIKSAAAELAISEKVIKADLGKILLKLEDIQQERIDGISEPKRKVLMNEVEEKAALAFLKDKKLLDKISRCFDEMNLLAGEKDNLLIAYLCLTSRQLEKPLNLIVQSSSSAGKSSLINAVLKSMPPEAVRSFTAMSEQSLFYMKENLSHSILSIAEEEGMKGLEYSFKILESEQELKIASTGKESKNGRFKTETYEVKGPVQVCFTTTSEDIDEELLNRSVVLSINEEAKQTELIHNFIRRRQSLEGLLQNAQKEAQLKVMHNSQRLLDKDIQVINPYAQFLRFPTHKTRLRRDFVKYLNLIKVTAFLHQHQREIKTVQAGPETIRYIEVELSDIAIANRLATKIFTSSLQELPSQSRKVLDCINSLAHEISEKSEISLPEVRLSRKQILEQVSCKSTQLHHHLKRLCQYEYLLCFSDSKSKMKLYQLHSLPDPKKELLGLTSTEELSRVEKIRSCQGHIRP